MKSFLLSIGVTGYFICLIFVGGCNQLSVPQNKIGDISILTTVPESGKQATFKYQMWIRVFVGTNEPAGDAWVTIATFDWVPRDKETVYGWELRK